MKRWLPRFNVCGWGGGDIDGMNDVHGWSAIFQWGPLLDERLAA